MLSLWLISPARGVKEKEKRKEDRRQKSGEEKMLGKKKKRKGNVNKKESMKMHKK